MGVLTGNDDAASFFLCGILHLGRQVFVFEVWRVNKFEHRIAEKEVVLAAAARIRSSALLRERVRSASLQERHIVGASVPRKEGWDKVTGAARYVDDMVLPGMLYAPTVRSNVARGQIRKLSLDPTLSSNDFETVPAQTNPPTNRTA